MLLVVFIQFFQFEDTINLLADLYRFIPPVFLQIIFKKSNR